MLLKVLLMADERIAQKDPLAVEFGRRGGKSRMRTMTPEARRRVAQLAARARWAKKAGAPVPPDPNGPGSPDRDRQGAEAGIMLTARRAARRANSERVSGRSHVAAA